jgi:hypothetical protein
MASGTRSRRASQEIINNINGGVNNINTGSNPIGTNGNPINNAPVANVNITTNNKDIDNKQDEYDNIKQSDNSQQMQELMLMMAKTLQQMSINSQSIHNSNTTNNPGSSNTRAAIDDKTQLIEFPKFNNKIIKPEAFIKWKRLVMDAVDGSPKYSPMLLDASKGWSEFKLSNAKYSIEYLEKYYLETHKSLWSLISSCFDNDVITSITTEIMNESINNNSSLPITLGFNHSTDITFYKDCKSLLSKLSSRYEIKSGWNICHLLKQFSCLEYKSSTDPMLYVEEFNSIYRKLQTLCPHYKIPDDMLAYQMLGQLPVECQAVKIQFLDTNKDTISINKVQETLISWWQSQSFNKSGFIPKNKENYKSNPHKANPADTEDSSTNDEISGHHCSYCKMNNHTADNCWKLQRKNNYNNNNNNESNEGQTNKKKSAKSYPAIESDSSSDDEQAAAISSGVRSLPQSRHILFDSGASSHFTCREDFLYNKRHIPPINVSTLAGNKRVDTTGSLKINNQINLNSVKFIPNGNYNLMSVSQVVNKGEFALFTKQGAYIFEPKIISKKTLDMIKQQSLLTFRHEGNVFIYNIQGIKDPPLNKGDFNYNAEGKPPQLPPENKKGEESQNARKDLQANRNKQTTADNKKDASVAAISINEQDLNNNENSSLIPDETACVTLTRSLSKNIPHNDKIETKDASIQTNLGINIDTESVNLHTKLAHLNAKSLQLTNDHYNLGISKQSIDYHSQLNCTTCISCKAKREPIGKLTANPLRKAKAIMDCWHIDLIGPLSEIQEGKRYNLPSLEGKIYILMIVDEYSRTAITCPIQQKSHAPQALIDRIKQFQVSTRLILKRVHSDGGSEFNNKLLLDFLKKQGTEYTYTTTDTPQLNGIAERMNQTITTMVRCMLKHGNLPAELWIYAYLYATYIHNRVCQPSLQGKVPIEILFPDQQSNLNQIHTFGCDAHVLIDPDNRGKLQSRTLPGVYLGYHCTQHAHKILLLDTLKIKISRDVQFVESSFTNVDSIRKQIKQSAEQYSTIKEKDYEVESIINHESRRGIKYYLVQWKGYEYPTWEPESNLTNCNNLLQEYKSKSDHVLALSSIEAQPQSEPEISNLPQDSNYPIPQSYKQAISHPDKKLWEQAINSELDSLAEFNTFTSCPLPIGRKPIDTRWVFAVKRDSNGKIIRHKARLVVKGFQQKEGIDYNETFSPTVKIKSLKILLAIAAQQDLEIKQLDFNTAFLNASLSEDIYVKTPEGYYNKPDKVLKLNKALYGLKQAPREWWLELDKFLKSLGYNSSSIDECLYVKHVNNKTIYLPLYVDDTLAIYHHSIEHIWLADKQALSNKFSVKDIGDCEWILHMAITRDRMNKTISLSQETYIKSILEQHNMLDIKPVNNPHWVNDITICPDNIEPQLLNESEHHLYRSIVGSMLYAANITRIDISYIIGVLARYTHQPYNYHLAAAKHVLRYLRGSMNHKLTFGINHKIIPNNDGKFNITQYTDSSWANEKDNRKSTGGWITTINGYPINWQSKKQQTIALSSTEAEYYALTECVNETIFIQQWFKFYGDILNNSPTPIKVKCDNQGAIFMSDHSTNHNRTKHIDIKHFYIREIIKQNKIKIEYIPTKDQLADILTKATTTQVFKSLISKLYH